MRILIIEDEESLAAAVKVGLEAEGFTVDVAHNGLDGLEMAREDLYDLVVLDILLPGMNGFQLCATLRSDANWVPILMLTAKVGELDETEAFVVLVARIRALLRRGRPVRPAVLAAGDLTLDPTEHRCRRGEVEIDLTPREFALLEFFLRVAGEAVTKRDILDHVWGDDFAGDPNIVEVYVGYLRRKIDAPFDRAALETVRGIGYRLNADGG